MTMTLPPVTLYRCTVCLYLRAYMRNRQRYIQRFCPACDCARRFQRETEPIAAATWPPPAREGSQERGSEGETPDSSLTPLLPYSLPPPQEDTP